MSADTSRSRESWRVACHAHDPIPFSIEASKIKANELDQPIRPEVPQAAGGSASPIRQLMDKRMYANPPRGSPLQKNYYAKYPPGCPDYVVNHSSFIY